MDSEQQKYMDLIAAANEEKYLRTGQRPLAFVHTYGCQQNVSDSEHISGMLENMGFGFTQEVKNASLALYNTCAVREHAQQRVFGNVGALKGIKRCRPEMIIAVCGCMTQQKDVAEKFRQSYPYVDLVFGTHVLKRFPEMLYGAINGKRIFELGGEDGITEGMPVKHGCKFKAWLPVMYGCNNFCTYCIVPYVRGRERSRRADDVVSEACGLVQNGAREITLLGQNVNSYGRDLDENVNFSELLRRINAIDGDFTIRFMTSHPKDATEELFDTIAECKKVERHLHLPFQSGSNRILKLMNRGYTRERYLDLAGMAKEKIPGISLTSDIIVGFPGETCDDFMETIDIVKKVRFDNLFTFIYSKRNGTPAASMDDPATHGEKAERLSRLLKIQESISAENMAERIGKNVRALCESCEDGVVTGRTSENTVIRFKGDKSKVGQFANVKIVKSSRSVLTGEIFSD